MVGNVHIPLGSALEDCHVLGNFLDFWTNAHGSSTRTHDHDILASKVQTFDEPGCVTRLALEDVLPRDFRDLWVTQFDPIDLRGGDGAWSLSFARPAVVSHYCRAGQLRFVVDDANARCRASLGNPCAVWFAAALMRAFILLHMLPLRVSFRPPMADTVV